ncbi:MAG: response regulator transcription factor [Pseudomonadota bacterium]|nr:response regulator transcription factor [Pseudomonadota bacterium]
MRILLVEDDLDLGDALVTGLKQYKYSVDWLKDGQSALQVLTKQHGKEHFDAVVLDVGLPGVSGMDITKALRDKHINTPIMVLTARNTINDKVTNLDLGADDYMVKPFDLKELCARLRSIIRRGSIGGQALPKLKLGDVTIDTAAHKVFISGKHVEFSRREFTLLNKLIEQTGKVVTREILSQTLYGWGDDVDSNAIEVHVHHIRKKIANAMNIKTIRGVGYIAETA